MIENEPISPAELTLQQKAARIAILRSNSVYVREIREDEEKSHKLEQLLAQLVIETQQTSNNRLLGLDEDKHLANLKKLHGGENPLLAIVKMLSQSEKDYLSRNRPAKSLFSAAISLAARPTLLEKFDFYNTHRPLSDIIFSQGRERHGKGGKIGSRMG